MRLKNVGAYPIRITKFLGPDGHWAGFVYIGSGYPQMSEQFYLAPGEEIVHGWPSLYPGTPLRFTTFQKGSDWLCGNGDGFMCLLGAS
ncbi:MAG: hypothetical protein QW275_00680 [Candidatus Anstonellaceae archaeon]